MKNTQEKILRKPFSISIIYIKSMIPFNHYSKVRDKFCLSYSGLSPEIAVQIDYALPFIRSTYPEMSFAVYMDDHFLPLVTDALPLSQLDSKRTEFAFIKELKVDPAGNHVLLPLIEDISFPVIPQKERKNLCLICPDAAFPFQSFPVSYVIHATVMARGYDIKIVGSDMNPTYKGVDIVPTMTEKIRLVESSGWVIGANNEYVYLAAKMGIKTNLIASAEERLLFDKMFPK